MSTGTPHTAASLEVLNGDLAGSLFPLAEETVIGRQEDDARGVAGQLNLPDSRVSRRHARIFFQRGHYYLEDLHSTNGTYLNAFRLQPMAPCALREGSNVQVGGIYLRFRPPPPSAATSEGGKKHTAWESEIGLNEEVFDLSFSTESKSDQSQADISMIFRAPELSGPDISLVLDAAEVMEGLRAVTAQDAPSSTQVLRRLRALAQVSIGMGAETEREALFAKVMDFIFVIFPTAERAFIVLQDKASSDYKPAAASTREPTLQGEVLTLSEAIVDEVVSQRRSILSTDAAQDRRFGEHESIINVGIRSVMCAPLLLEDEVTGLIQVDTRSQAHSFTQEDLHILTGVGAQVAIALKNFRLYEDIENLFEGFVTASVHAIEARDPTTAGHSFRVAEYTQRLATAVDACQIKALRDSRFSAEQMRELRYAALLHDFGKVGVREHVLIKAKKLYHSQLDLLQARFRFARASLERQAYRELIDQHADLSPQAFKAKRAAMEKTLARETQRLQQFLRMIQHTNEPTVTDDVVSDDLRAVADYRFPGNEGETLELLTIPELDALTLSRGSLTPDERHEIQSHVSHTFAFLQHIPWTGTLASVADIAHAHHEKLDGSGYPLGLAGDAIPLQSRIMTVADIFDALTAGDRPYKCSLDVESALDILNNEAKQGKVDPLLVDVFIDSGAFQLFDVP